MTERDGFTPVDADVLVIGYGPVGQALSILLGHAGHRVIAVERWQVAYPRPRAVHFDDEIARVLAAAGLGDRLPIITQPSDDYHWRNAEGETLIRFDWSGPGPSGWPSANMFNQPTLEHELSTVAESLGCVSVRRGSRAVALDETDDAVRVTLVDEAGRESAVTARYVVGCDGANSFVREQMHATMTDLGFFYDWLIVDVVVHDDRAWSPINLQVCDPARPTTRVSGGPGKRRWEFMRLPHETIEELNTEQTAWRLLEPWDVTPDNATLERHTVYTFQARWADEWRQGRLLLAGDAAHLMPPFAGQGMCSGIRDAANLAWKLGLVLTGRATTDLLDTYMSERLSHLQHSIGMSVELGRVICLTDPTEVAARDEVMLKAGGRPEVALPPLPPAVLGPGVVHTTASGEPAGLAGQLSIQGRVRGGDGVTGRFDEVVGTGFVVLSARPLHGVLDESALAVVRELGARLVHVASLGQADPRSGVISVEDVDGTYRSWFETGGFEAAVVRPDYYLFGTVASVDQISSMLVELGGALRLRQAALPIG